MLPFLLRRLGLAVATIFLVVTVGFVLGRLTGAPGALLLPDNASTADVDALNARLGFDRPVIVQYLDFLGGLFVGDFGDSYRRHEPALGLVLERVPATVELAFWAFIAGFALALIAALAIQLTGSRLLRAIVGWSGAVRQSVPDFFFALLLVLVFSVLLGVLPSLGRTSPASLALPVITLATGQFVMYLRLLDAALSEQAEQDYVRTAFAQGHSRASILLTQMLPNALAPVLGMAGLNLGGLLGGTVVVEVVFAWPGLGSLLTDAVSQRDFPIVQAGLLFVALMFVLVNTLVDTLVSRIDTRTAQS
ncbi:dipeptide/oligopeptide/nickel ABC transporter permease protein [Microbacterium sp. TS-1]|uniref:ABC transporter permease n=1 Tax=Microbacterium sp. TS-1 TaxID=1344956 RepID=UPI00038FDDD6|nr:ABC transporter permease [Microbacterium sp. TS-1]GAD34082.1 dipeptide/oligopeptide/nickel ABC transporter permease protein [Microbacterium sp. TS-1]